MARKLVLVFFLLAPLGSHALTPLENRALDYANSYQAYSYLELEKSITRITPQIISLVKECPEFDDEFKVQVQETLNKYKSGLLREIEMLGDVESLRDEVRPVLEADDFSIALEILEALLGTEHLHNIFKCALAKAPPTSAPLDVRAISLASCLISLSTKKEELSPIINLIEGFNRLKRNLANIGIMK